MVQGAAFQVMTHPAFMPGTSRATKVRVSSSPLMVPAAVSNAIELSAVWIAPTVSPCAASLFWSTSMLKTFCCSP